VAAIGIVVVISAGCTGRPLLSSQSHEGPATPPLCIILWWQDPTEGHSLTHVLRMAARACIDSEETGFLPEQSTVPTVGYGVLC
jgi:hypothetical protein